MLSYRLGTVNDFHWVFKPVLNYSKPNSLSTFFKGTETWRFSDFVLETIILNKRTQSLFENGT